MDYMKKFRISKDEDRTNLLSLMPGGHFVTTVDVNMNQVVYDKIKDPEVYLDKVHFNNRKIVGAFIGTGLKNLYETYVHNKKHLR